MDNYNAIINKVVDYIEENLSEVINLKDIANVSEISKYHFHKIFKSVTGETIAEFIKRVRLEKSADMLIRTTASLTAIAVDTGFSSSSVFSREFKRKYSISPREFRLLFTCLLKYKSKKQEIMLCSEKKEYFEKAILENHSLSEIMRISKNLSFSEDMSFKIETIPEYHVLYMRYVGEYSDMENIYSLWIALKKISDSYSIYNKDSLLFSIIHDNPNICEFGKCRYDACISIPNGININILKNQVGYRIISGGKYAIFNFKGNINNLFQAYTWIDTIWFKKTGYEPDSRPPYFKHTNSAEFSELLEFEIFVPVKKI